MVSRIVVYLGLGIGKGDNEEWRSYEIEKLVGRRSRGYGYKTVLEYLVHWKGYGKEHD